MKRKINVGAGAKIQEGPEWDNLDCHNRYGANILWDLNYLPIQPILDNTYEYVLCSHVLEDWADPQPLMKELVRICKVGGLIEIHVPNETRIWDSLQHKRGFTLTALCGFAADIRNYSESYHNPIVIKEMKFYMNIYSYKGILGGINYYYGKFMIWVFNRVGYKIVDRSFIKYLWPYTHLKIIYRKVRKNN